ncbi:MAG: hypothetical protein ACKVOQ_19070 [Cyclobacteriaceae bacterium]
MKKVKFHFVFISLAYLFTLLGCDSSKVAPSFDTQLLAIPNGWKISAATISPALNGVTDYYSKILPDCGKDNLMFFKKDGSYKTDEGSTKCDPSDSQSIEGTWSFITAKNLLAFTPTNPDDFALALTIVSLTSTSFVYTSQLDLLGQNYTIKVTLVPN